MHSHIRALGILNLVLGGLCLLAGLMGLLFFGGLAGLVGMVEPGDDKYVAIPILGGIGVLVLVAAAIVAVPGIIAGIGILKLRPWGRVLGIVISVLNLICLPPLSTVLGIYGLWVLLSEQSVRVFAGRGAVD